VYVCKKGVNQDQRQWRRKQKTTQTLTSSRSIYAPARPRTPLTSRYAENWACKRGALESCVAHRKWRKVAVCVCDVCRVRAREGASRAARDGEEGCGGRHVGRHREPRVQIVRACSASKECHLACVSRARGCVDCGWIRDGHLSRRDQHAGARGRAHIGGRWNEERGVYASQRCEDGIAGYAQVVVHAAWTRPHGAPWAVAWTWVERALQI
jgi:hypothetical protein